MIVLGLCIVCAYLIKIYRFYYLPESGAAMLVGLIVGAWYVQKTGATLNAKCTGILSESKGNGDPQVQRTS